MVTEDLMDVKREYLACLLASLSSERRPTIWDPRVEDMVLDFDWEIRADPDGRAHQLHVAHPWLRDWAARQLAQWGSVEFYAYVDPQEANEAFEAAGVSAFAETGRDWFYGHLNTPECPYVEVTYIRVGCDVTPEYVESFMARRGWKFRRV